MSGANEEQHRRGGQTIDKGRFRNSVLASINVTGYSRMIAELWGSAPNSAVLQLAPFVSKILIILFLTAAPIAALAQEAPARSAWRLFVQECEHILQDPQAYLDAEIGTAGKLTFKKSPDARSLAINKTVGNQYVEAFIYRFTDREVRNCAVYLNNPSVIDTGKYAAELGDWLSADLGHEVIGGHAPLYTDEYVMGVMGAWPQYDLDTRVWVGPYETQFFVLRTEMME